MNRLLGKGQVVSAEFLGGTKKPTFDGVSEAARGELIIPPLLAFANLQCIH